VAGPGLQKHVAYGVRGEVWKRAGEGARTSPSNLYAAVIQDSKICGFASRLNHQSWVQRSKVGAKLGRVLVLDSVKTKGAGCFDVFEDVVDEDGLRCGSIHGFEGGLKDHWRRFAGANRTGVDTSGGREELEKGECGFKMCNVNRIGVGEQSKLVLF